MERRQSAPSAETRGVLCGATDTPDMPMASLGGTKRGVGRYAANRDRHCEELGRTAHTEEFPADRVRERIEAKSQKDFDLERENEQLESKIAEAEGRAAGN